jgi:hypothetical protein
MSRLVVLTPSGAGPRLWPGGAHMECLQLAQLGQPRPTVLAVDDRSKAGALLLRRVTEMKLRHPQWLFAVLTCEPHEARRLPLQLWPAESEAFAVDAPPCIHAGLGEEGVTFEFEA